MKVENVGRHVRLKTTWQHTLSFSQIIRAALTMKPLRPPPAVIHRAVRETRPASSTLHVPVLATSSFTYCSHLGVHEY